MVWFLLLLCLPPIAANILFYEWPYYLGRSFTSQNDTSNLTIPWRDGIQSISMSPNESLITYDQENFQGNNATWYRSVVYPGNWKTRIRSYRIVPVIAPPIDPEKQNLPVSQAPWYFMRTWEGFILVRMSAQWPGYPECYAMNGVNCIVGREVDEAFRLLIEYKDHVLHDKSTTFNAPCGPASHEHWGTDAPWCGKAMRQLSAPDRNVNDIQCRLGATGIIAYYAQACIPLTHGDANKMCYVFSTMESCQVTVKNYLFSPVYMWDSLQFCGKWEVSNNSDIDESGRKQASTIALSIGGIILLIILLLHCCRKRPNTEPAITERGARNTSNSSIDDMEERTTSPHLNNNAYVRAQ